jgi:hypothetical protein
MKKVGFVFLGCWLTIAFLVIFLAVIIGRSYGFSPLQTFGIWFLLVMGPLGWIALAVILLPRLPLTDKTPIAISPTPLSASSDVTTLS